MEIAVPAAPAMADGIAHHAQDAGFGALDRGVSAGVRVADELGGRPRVLPVGDGGSAVAETAGGAVQFDGFWRGWGWEDAEHRSV